MEGWSERLFGSIMIVPAGHTAGVLGWGLLHAVRVSRVPRFGGDRAVSASISICCLLSTDLRT